MARSLDNDAADVVEALRAVAPPGAAEVLPVKTETATVKVERPVEDDFHKKEREETRRKEEKQRKEEDEKRQKEEEKLRKEKEDKRKERELASLVKEEVKEESLECLVPGVALEQLLAMTNQDIWEYAWSYTWQQQAAGADTSSEQGKARIMKESQRVWKGWMAERDKLIKQQKDRAGEEAKQKERAAEEARQRASRQTSEASSLLPGLALPAATTAAAKATQADEPWRRLQDEAWRKNKAAQADWQRLTSELEQRNKSKDAPKTGRDLCSIAKQRCPADQPLPFERLLAVCPKGTTVQQLIQAMAKEPKDFRQSWDGSEFCVRPANSRCVDWLPVQPSTVPSGFQAGASLPEEMLVAAKDIFEERIKPQGQAAEDPLVAFLSTGDRAPADTPLKFSEILTRCPPGTEPKELVNTMSRRKDVFRQSADGTLFCVRPRQRCKDFMPVNPYLNPAKLLS
eukprot:gnl/TRDRNA2_/TRDRNA2_171280_c1_seq2.p1 gnl/TRDRNA2_/TRDRNA2_171280_c1~~gnl/TRDRNA2_/TRDRNA2_171280_c1_seq2.p1  ORF type:complete len:457 (-),score=124.75 gnl/TRDRNA2_/TRDRNA2_171280_c1_seq2:147-1517(-)